VTATAVTNTYAYDGFARRISVTGGRGNATFTHYNALGQVQYTEDAAGNRTTFGYDALGRRTSETDALTNTVFTAYDSLGNVTAQWGATYPVAYEYDASGRMTAMHTTRDGTSWDATYWIYDHATGLATGKTYADGNGTAYTHTPEGKLATRTWARGVATAYAYNADGLPIATIYSDATPGTALTYDALLRPAIASNAVAQYAYANDALCTATNETVTLGGTVATLARGMDNRYRMAEREAAVPLPSTTATTPRTAFPRSRLLPSRPSTPIPPTANAPPASGRAASPPAMITTPPKCFSA
jgi:YD repeat-containing protein